MYWLFGLLFFLVPLILWPYTSELFEFNKMVLVYLLTVPVVTVWIIRCIIAKKFIFRRTILDIPLLVFLGSQIISTLISIDPQTSIFGYYSRFNGGLLSTISYLILYWAFVSNIDKENARKLININLWSAAVVSIYGVLEHFGIDKEIWQQDVQSRVFSTLGQPNWLSAWITALIPITWLFLLNTKLKINNPKFLASIASSLLLFWTLIFTKSRSGLLGIAVSFFVFWGIYFWLKRNEIKSTVIPFILVSFSYIAICFISGTDLTPSIQNLISKPATNQAVSIQTGGTVLDTGGTESGVIRKIVWEGAIDVWKKYPIFGSGVETFAYSYYMFRPAAHNLTSEWDFIYNKAHNEYLNFLANTGIVGTLSYLLMVGVSIYLLFKNTFQTSKPNINPLNISLALSAGYVSILVTNFFGFSVVPIQLLFYLYPAFSVVFTSPDLEETENKNFIEPNHKTVSWFIIFLSSIVVFYICRYWYTDTLYATGYNYNRASRFDLAPQYLSRAISLNPKQGIYYSELARSYTNLALAYNEAKESTTASELTKAAIANSIKSVSLSPANVNLKRVEFGVYVMLSTIDPTFLTNAKDVLIAATSQAPTDAKLIYNLGLIYSKLGQNDLALDKLRKTTELKANYKDARLAYAVLLIDAKRYSEAKTQLEYVLANIDPNDSVSKQYLESLK
jgi:putative inorganic carbon (HCO3(-)) transporter